MLDYLELGWSLTEGSTSNLIGISNQIKKILLTPYRCAFCQFFFFLLYHAFMQTRCDHYSLDTLLSPSPDVQCHSAVWRSSHGEVGWEGRGCLYLLENRHPVYILYAVLLPNSTGVAGCWSDCAAVGPLSPCAPWLEGAGSPWLNPAVVKALGGGPSICIAK